MHALRPWNEGDADEIAPSLYQGRGSRGKAKSDTTEPTTTGTETPATTTPVATGTTPAALPHTGSVGTPDSNPFMK